MVVTNASPLIALDRVGLGSLLGDLFGVVYVPPAVEREVFAAGEIPGWITVVHLTDPLASAEFATRLGLGERETISLALELGASEVVIDDLPARRLAATLGLPVIGTLGVLLRAKHRGLVPTLRPVIEALVREDFRVAEGLVAAVLAAAGELEG